MFLNIAQYIPFGDIKFKTELAKKVLDKDGEESDSEKDPERESDADDNISEFLASTAEFGWHNTLSLETIFKSFSKDYISFNPVNNTPPPKI